MSPRLNLLPDPALAGLSATLRARLERLGMEIEAASFAALLDPVWRKILHQGFTEAGAHEGTVWLVDPAGEFLVPAYNSGPRAAEIVGQFKQPLSRGLISMVFATEQPFLENAVAGNPQQSKLLDAQLQVATHALVAVPFHYLSACRGVISGVQIKSPAQADPPGFRPEHLAGLQATAALLRQLVEYRLLRRIIGWDCE